MRKGGGRGMGRIGEEEEEENRRKWRRTERGGEEGEEEENAFHSIKMHLILMKALFVKPTMTCGALCFSAENPTRDTVIDSPDRG